MSSGAKKRQIKSEQIRKIFDLLQRHDQIIIVQLENVGSNQVQQARKALQSKKATLVIGKNTVIRKAIKLLTSGCDKNDVDSTEELEYYNSFARKPQLQALSDVMRNKVGLILSDTAVHELKTVIEANKVQAVARPGTIAPLDVAIQPGPTGLDPSQIAFFHALQITTKIQKGQIEITNEVKVCIKGTLVTPSQAALLEKLNIKPFQYGMEIVNVYDDGQILSAEQASISPEQVAKLFSVGVSNLTGLSLGLGFANTLSAPHLVANAFKNVLALSLGSDYKLAILDSLSAQAPAQQAPQQSAGNAKNAPKVEEKKKEPEPEPEEEDVGLGDLF